MSIDEFQLFPGKQRDNSTKITHQYMIVLGAFFSLKLEEST